jgi:hypothetical protein
MKSNNPEKFLPQNCHLFQFSAEYTIFNYSIEQ